MNGEPEFACLTIIYLHHSFTWDTPVQDILGDELEFNDTYATSKVSLRDLLSHKVGFASHDMLWFFAGVKDQAELIT